MGTRRTALLGVSACVAISALAPAAADASSVQLTSGGITYKAAAGETNTVTVARSGSTVTFDDSTATVNAISTSGPGSCTAIVHHVSCTVPNTTQIKVQLGDGNDSVDASGVPDGAKLGGGEGNDNLLGGPGADDLEGDEGDDVLRGAGGTDSYEGGDGSDWVQYFDHTTPVSVTIDDVANDGSDGENEQIPADVEGVLGGQGDDTLTAGPNGSTLNGGPGNDRVIGGAGDDTLYGGKNNDVVDGGGGEDMLFGDLGDDQVLAGDGIVDQVSCGDGSDAAQVDPLDVLAGDCETTSDSNVFTGGPSGGDSDPSRGGDPGTGDGTTSGTGGGDTGAGSGSGSGDQPPAPKPGRTVTADPARGTIAVQPPGGGDFAPLATGDSIPVGSTVDATKGTVALTAAADSKGNKTQTAEFSGGVFKVKQKRATTPVTELVLVGKIPSCKTTAAGKLSAASSRGRRLWGSGHGHFRTRGRHSSATVRGTIWLTEDRCDGTYTRVQRGIVAVKDFTRHKTKLVTAGKHYFAPAKQPKH
jgi:hypothetical protein